jgi:bifunctional UDP-N-acetylglucosamine pyrophosphorylase/glucosamine-1-phosphate N-acetyltransferase
MHTPTTQVIVLAAGIGSRFKIDTTKMLIPICGQPMVLYTIQLFNKLQMPITVVVGFQKELVKAAILQTNNDDISFAEQPTMLGTGHALLCSQSTWHADNILVMNGDMPLVTPAIIERLCTEHLKNAAAISIITAHDVDPSGAYGRIVKENGITKIVEAKHFTHKITDYPQINAGIYLINRAFLETYLDKIECNEVTREFYITDLVELASRNGKNVVTIEVPFELVHGVNTFKELHTVEQVKQHEIIHNWMADGVHFLAPHTTRIEVDVTIGSATVVESGAQLLGNTIIGNNCTIGAFSVIRNSCVRDSTTIGTHSVLESAQVPPNVVLKPFSCLSTPTGKPFYTQQIKPDFKIT